MKRPSKFAKQLRGKIKRVLNNMMFKVTVFLTGTWISIAWIVYQVDHKAQGANITTFTEGLWWGIVTFLTVGYGDRYPVTNEARIAGGVLMLAGVGAIGIVTAKISQYFLEKAIRDRRGVVDPNKLNNHFVICGWKDDMANFFAQILELNDDLTSGDMVIVANLKDNIIEDLKAHPKLHDLHVVVGDYFSENTLKRAAPERARKVMILADKTEGANGQIPTPTEVDARTIMTAMTLSTIAKNTVVTAEILDPKMDQYLRIANVSEIIYSRESNRLMLVNASAGTGITNIIFDLMDPKTNAFIATEAIDEKFLNRPYGELKEWYWKNRRSEILVGILENSGSKNSMKEWALKRAQKTTDVNRLLQNLAAVKVMKVNNPVFNPADDYVVPEGCMAIVVETKADESKGGAHARPQAAA